jgi:integrase
MAILSAKILKHQKRADGTYNVKICIAHKDEKAFIDTPHVVTDKQIRKDLSIKDEFIIACVNKSMDSYRRTISDLADKLDQFSAKALKQYFIKKDEKVDFLIFCQLHIDLMEKDGRKKSKANFNTVRNSLFDFLKNKKTLPIEYITLEFIGDYERFLRGPRKMTRLDRLGREYVITGKPLGDASVHIYLRDFQGLYSAAMSYYNKPSIGLTLIPFNPFAEYKIVDAPETEKRSLEVDELIKIRDCQVKTGSRAELAKNLGLLSFYLCGINAVDLFKKEYQIKNGRLEYNRSKTKGKRKDKAFISIKIPKEAEPLLKFAEKIPTRYSTIDNLNHALSEGMAMLSKTTLIPDLEFYRFRHSVGTHARNTCRKSKDDVALALNHVDQGRKTTDIYIKKDWTIVDEVQDAVISLLRRTICSPQLGKIINLVIGEVQISYGLN